MKVFAGQELKNKLKQIDFSPITQEFLQSCFRVRCKVRDTGEYTFQARHDFELHEQNLDSIREEIAEKLASWNFDQIIVEYKSCCCEGCIGCQRFTGEM